VSPGSLGTIAAAQRDFLWQAAKTRADALRESYDASTTEEQSARTRLLSCACGLASTWLDTLPLTKALELKSGEVHTGLPHRLGISMLPSNAHAVQSDCGAPLCPTDVDHGMRCPSLAARTTMHHGILKGMLRRIKHRVCIASTQDPALCRLPGLTGGADTSVLSTSTRVEARTDILLVLPRGITIADISAVHPLSINTLPSKAIMAGTASAQPGQQKRAAYAQVEPSSYPFVPFSVESCGRLGQSAMKLMHALGDKAAGGVKWVSFVGGALHELSVGLTFCAGSLFLCIVHVWEYLLSTVGQGSSGQQSCPSVFCKTSSSMM
jgi:hypothetical protein